ncbi:MAG TPA: Nramp family divalent metal transporter [Gaiellaceae bacterium]|jgi:manganese transport protein|nr:Nramp family divalent metal transporter [Gaiellaceae bacterium]
MTDTQELESAGRRTAPGVDVGDVLPGEAATLRAAQASLAGESKGMRGLWPFLGPAFIAAVAYIDPGNFATNIAGGAKYGYMLLWVVLAANLMAMLVQTLSAKLGIATGRNLPETCRDNFSKPVSIALWIQAEAIAMATDLAEVLGAALGLHLLFGMPLFPAGLLAGAGAFGILALQRYGFRRLEAVIAAMVGVIVVAFAFEVVLARPDPGSVAGHLFVPRFDGSESVLIAAGILGATVMPHVVYLHSALTQNRIVGRDETEKRRIQRFERIDVIIAMTIAGIVNMSMLAIAAAVFFGLGIESIEDAYSSFDTELGGGAAILFGIALLASGFSSSSVGTLAGQVVMQGFIQRQIPIFLRRAITLAPALIILAIGVDPSRSLVISQVVLSFGIPFALIPLVIFTSRRSLMGSLVNTKPTTLAAWAIAGIIISLNVFLLYETFIGG